jgi:ataxin-3
MEFIKSIYHEQQDAALCAMHCLNNLLQQKQFSEEDFVEIARGLDENEEKLMSEMGRDTEEYKEYIKMILEKGSQNISDDGNFSVQTLMKALEIFGLELTDINHPSMKYVKEDPSTRANAFICNYASHWLALRRFGSHWFNLNSILEYPEYVSPTYLSLYLEQLRTEGYTIYVVVGNLPQCELDLLADYAFDPIEYNTVSKKTLSTNRIMSPQNNDDDLQKAIRMSLSENQSSDSMNQEDEDLQLALRLSMQPQ